MSGIRVVFFLRYVSFFFLIGFSLSLYGEKAGPVSALSLEQAKGFGLDTVGGLGGRVLKVTNLASKGAGSLAWALQQSGPRVVVFEVGGVIDLKGEKLKISQPYLTLAGQTAPSPGITIIRGGLLVRAHDIRIEHIRVRPGDNFESPLSGWDTDGIAVSRGNAKRVHIDHVSVSWAVDENFSATGQRTKGWGYSASDVTFSNCIVAEALDYASHEKGRHSKGLLVHDYVKNVAVLGNLFISNDRRNPYFKSHATGVVVNNLMYNVGNHAVYVDYIIDEWERSSLQPGNPKIAVVGNVLRYGRDTYSDLALVYGSGDVYLRDNKVFNLQQKPMPHRGSAVKLLEAPPVWPEGLKAMDVNRVEKSVLANAGARPWDRDEVDQRIIDSYKSRSSRIIDSQSDVGGYPKYPEVRRPLTVPDENISAWLQSFKR